MKKFFSLMAAIFLMASGAMAQEVEDIEIQPTKKVFAQIMGINKNVLGLGSKVSVEIDFGDEKGFWGNDGRNILVDENGKDIKFNSMVDAMNFMGERGWVYEDSYVVTVAKQNVIHWLLSKDIPVDQDARGDIRQKRDARKEKKSKKKDTKNHPELDPIYQ